MVLCIPIFITGLANMAFALDVWSNTDKNYPFMFWMSLVSYACSFIYPILLFRILKHVDNIDKLEQVQEEYQTEIEKTKKVRAKYEELIETLN